MPVRLDVALEYRESGTVPEVRNKELEDEEVKKNSAITTVKRKDIPGPTSSGIGRSRGYTSALCELKVGGDGVFLPTSQVVATSLGYRAAAILSGIRFSVRSVDGGAIVTRES